MMLFALVACIVLLGMGAKDLGLKGILGVVAFLVACGAVVAGFGLHPIAFTVPLALVDIGLVLKIFGGDIAIR